MKINLIKLTLNQLLMSGTHLGDIKRLLNGKMKSYLLGFKGKLNIFDIKYTHLQLKMILNCISNLICLRQQILLVNHYYESMKIPHMVGIKNFCFFLEGRWLGGILTNYKTLRLTTNYLENNYPQLIKLNFMPSFIIILNTTEDNWSLKEAINLNIPVALVTGTSFDSIDLVNYPIPSNNKSYGSLKFFSKIIYTSILRGILEEKFKIFKTIK